jgi:hypothetical protein
VRLLLGLSFILLLAAPVAAEEAFTREVGATVPGHRGTTFLSLLQQAIPALDATSRAADVVPPENPFGGPSAGSATAEISEVMAIFLRADGAAYLAVLAPLAAPDAAEQPALLALYDPDLKLTDAVDVGFDKETWLVRSLQIGPSEDAVVTRSEHSNSNQTYDTTAVLRIDDGRFQPIDLISMFGESGCGILRTQALELSTDPASPGLHWPIAATVRAEESRSGEDCGRGEGSVGFHAKWIGTLYNWSDAAGAYLAIDDTLQKLAKENARRY